ncbi:MAG: prepilin-type N-terminal cleavage/methylation domain-containing protein [Akkermansia sp.]|nr:prepilin-type N-terminal cleavage/methylation domain-containing protein [Akkermansia sp.]
MNVSKKILRGGFTLIELIVAMAITAILVYIIGQLTQQGVALWNSVRQDVSTSSYSRSALQVISHDLEAFQMRSNNKYQWFHAKADKTPDNAPKGLKIPRSAQCVFFACAPDRNPSVSSSSSLRGNYREARSHNQETQGDVNTISYRLMYRDQILNLPASSNRDDTSSFPLFALYRQVIPPRETFEHLLGKDNLEQAYAGYEMKETENFLCENIVEMNIMFTIQYTDNSADAKKGRAEYKSVTVPVVASYSRGSVVSVYGDRIEVDGTTYNNARIVSANVSITVLTEEGMALINQIRLGRRRAPKAADFFAKYTRSFSRLVALPQPI